MKSALPNSLKQSNSMYRIVLLTIAFFSIRMAGAQTPSPAASDAAAQQLMVGMCAPNLSYNDATVNDPSAVNCGSITRDAWLWFDATSSKSTIHFFNGSNRNAAIYIYTGMPGALSEVSCMNDMGNGKSEMMILNTTSGTRYRVRIAKVGGGPQALTGDVCVFNTPANDDCLSAMPLTVNASCVGTPGTTQGATESIAAGACGGKSDDDVWYSFVATAAGATIAVTNASVGFNPVLELRTGVCKGSSITCMDANNTNGNEIISASGLTIGQTYFIRVYGFAETSFTTSGTFNICVTDLCAAIVSYNVIGGGSYCTGSAGLPVGLSNSDIGFSYQLKLNGSNVGSPISGTGSAISFGIQAAAGSYTVSASSISNPSCSFTMSGSVSIYISSTGPFPFIGNITTSAMAACVGSSFTATVQPVQGATEYVWRAPDGTAINGVQISPIVTSVASASNTVSILTGAPFGSGYYIFVYARNGCGRTVNEKAIWVQGTLSTPAIVGSKTVCTSSNAADVVIYSASAVTGADDYKWTVTTNSGTPAFIVGSDTLSSVSIHYPTGFSSGTVSVVGRMNCGYVSGSRTILVNTLPAIPGAISGSDYVCPASASTYKLTLTEGAASVTWTLPAGATLVSSGRNATHDTAVVQFPASFATGTVCATPTSSCGQAGMIRCKSVYAALPKVPSSITGPLSGGCNTTLQYSSSPSSLQFADEYQWTLNGNIVAGQNGSTASISFVNGGTLCVRGINKSCPAPSNAGGQRCINVAANPGSLGSISGPATVCAGGTYVFSVLKTNGLTYNWSIPSGCTMVADSGNSITVLWGITGGGVVNVTANNGCGNSNTSSLNVSIMACRMAVSASSETLIAAYPNPAQDQITVAYQSLTKEVCTIRFVDLTGRMVMEQHHQVTEGFNYYVLNLETLTEGIYLLQVESPSQGVHTSKVMVK